MIESRPLQDGDYELLKDSLERDEFHQDTTPAFFRAPGTVCDVYSDELGPVLFVRNAKSLRVDIQFVDNEDRARNAKVLLNQFEIFTERARASGYTELVFCTNSPMLKEFCKKQFGYKEIDGELRKLL